MIFDKVPSIEKAKFWDNVMFYTEKCVIIILLTENCPFSENGVESILAENISELICGKYFLWDV